MTSNVIRSFGAWLDRVEAPDAMAEARALRRVREALRRAGPVGAGATWRGATAAWARTLVPLAAAAGLLGALLLQRLGMPESVVATTGQESEMLDVIRRNDAETYLVNVAVTNYRNDWATGLVGSSQ